MTQFSLAARNLLVLDSELVKKLGRSSSWLDGWVFDTRPLGATLENSQRAWVVVSEDAPWANMNAHNNMHFPRLLVDIWADPTRNEDRSVKFFDADDKIEAIIPLLDRHFHTTNLDVEPDAASVYGTPGQPRMWGTAEQIASNTGKLILGSQRSSGPSYSDVTDGNGARMARLIYNVTTV